jgi:hypothetical protein
MIVPVVLYISSDFVSEMSLISRPTDALHLYFQVIVNPNLQQEHERR